MNHILFPITYACNLSCKFCVARNSKIIDVESSIEALNSKKGEIEWVYITGGEPFLIQDLAAVCDRIKAMGFKVGITTNGTIFRPEIAGHVDRMGISFDGDKEYHDTYRGEGVFDKAQALFYAVKGKCETVIMSVAFKENQDALKRLEPIVEQMDPTYWQIQRDMFDPDVKIPVQV
jgi:MoaA/NifB/PqqE/SkfB family radical SAM enzyme